jgi:gliding motility-associated-like protein
MYDTLALCSGSQLFYRGEVITSPGDYIITQNNPEQCDSLFYLHVALSSVIRNESIRTLCDGDSLFIFNQWVYDDTTLEETFVSSSGCDSVSVVVVNVVLLPERTLTISLCVGDSVQVYNSWLSDVGMYDFRIANTADCDSLITVTIDLIESSAHYDTLSFCEGDTLMFDGSLITTSTNVTVTRLSSTGCDSIFYIRAEMLPLHQKEISLTLCPGDSVLISGEWFDSSGVFTYKTNAVSGCDTLHTVRVDILQPPQAPDILADCETGEVVVSILASENWLVEWDNGDTTFLTRYQSGEEAEVSFFAEPDCRGKFTVQLPAIPDPDLIELPEDTVTDGTRSIRLSLNLDPQQWNIVWSPASAVDCSICAEVTVTIDNSTEMILSLEHISGCVYEHRFRIETDDQLPVWNIPNIFAPTSSTENNRWLVTPPVGVVIKKCAIYDRWANKVYETKSDEPILWDGSFAGKEVIPGVYVYLIEWVDSRGNLHVTKGDVTVLK